MVMIISVMMMMMIIRISEGCSIAGCSGHGICDKEVLKCKCYDGFTGPDCATRSCAGGPAWVGFANGTNDVHSVIAECSNMGTCNEATGLCTCDSGFEGFACERMSCPKGTNNEECSGHGRCLTLEIMALTNDGNHLEYSTDYNDWDADRIKGCACDQGWEGYDCSERADCPLGDDPFTLGQVDEVQVLDCTCTRVGGCTSDDTFTLGFRGLTTASISSLSDATELKSALTSLRNVDDIEVTIETNGAVQICSDLGVTTSITFTHNPGSHPAMIVTATSLLNLNLASKGTASALTGSVLSVTGTRERIPCSGRGRCVLGSCECFHEFGHSDGSLQAIGHDGSAGNVGNRANCGRFQGTTASTAHCPKDTDGSVCHGHGTCDQSTGYLCECEDGYTGRYCGGMQCRLGYAWSAEPRDKGDVFGDGGAHPWGWECSNRGRCDRSSGTCTCDVMMEGEACQHFKCPNNDCGTYGTCVNLKNLTAETKQEGVSLGFTYDLWDAYMIRGCLCQGSIFHGPLLGDVSDFLPHDCKRMSCPTGDDPYTTDQSDEIQTLNCDATSGTLTLTFRGETTSYVQYNDNLATLKSKLESLSTITGVNVQSNDGSDSVCVGGGTTNVDIRFTHQFGDLPLITLDTSSLSGFSTTPTVTESTKGTKEEAECSNRGHCDRTRGRCKCFDGVCSSDGSGNLGQRGDCGFINDQCKWTSW